MVATDERARPGRSDRVVTATAIGDSLDREHFEEPHRSPGVIQGTYVDSFTRGLVKLSGGGDDWAVNIY